MKAKVFARLLFFCLFSVYALSSTVFADSSEACSNSDPKSIEQYVTNCLGLPAEVAVESNDGSANYYSLNIDLLDQHNLIVYGSPEVVPNNEYKNGQYRYWGYVDSSGALFPNLDFPEDRSGGNYMTRRNLIYRPWEDSNTYHTRTYTPIQPTWWKDASREEVAQQLSRVVDKYYGTPDSPQGDFANLNQGMNWANWLYDYAVFSQASTKFSPGIITEMHQTFSPSQLWYDSFMIQPEYKPFGDLWIDDSHIEFTNPKAGEKTDIKIKVYSSFNIPMYTKLFYRFDTDSEPMSIDVADIPAEQWDDATQALVAGELLVTIPDVTMPYWGKLQAASNGRVQVASNNKATISTSFIAHINPLHNSPPKEITPDNPEDGFANNRAEWGLMRILDDNEKPIIKTPPIYFKNITPYEGTPYWDEIHNADLDRYEAYCSPTYGIVYTGPDLEFNYEDLTPSTTYECQLQAFDKDGNSGGFTTGTFTTLPIQSPSGSGYWKDRGLIREINSEKQSIGQIPTRALDLSQYSAEGVRGAANIHSPYFGEWLGVFGKPVTYSTTYYWKFKYSYWSGHRWRTATATDSCKVEYVPIAPSGWTNIKNDPAEMTMKVSNDFNDTQVPLKVTHTKRQECRGSDSRNPDPHQFYYYVPDQYETEPASVLLYQGFDSVTNQIESDYTNLKLFIEAPFVTLGSDGVTLSVQKQTKTEIPFQMKWTMYSVIGVGG